MTVSDQLECHPASEVERIAAYQNVYDVWPMGENLEEHLVHRQASVQHNRAAWFVGCVNQRVVASLACYPLAFHFHNEVVLGFAIGSVHTVREFRRRGCAAQLLSWVEAFQARNGRTISLLFSDIDPAYYARWGYVTCPAWESHLEIDPANSLLPQADYQLVLFDPHKAAAPLHAAYTRCHRDQPCSIARDVDYWNYLVRKRSLARFYWITDARSNPLGYVCLQRKADSLRLLDFAIDSEHQEPLGLALVQFASANGIKRLTGWLPDEAPFSSGDFLAPRKQEITMIKSLDPQRAIDFAIQQAAGRFHEIDHV